jgi:hypothetical protein
MAFEKYILPDAEDAHVASHQLGAVLGEYARGEKTKNECLAALEANLAVILTNDEKTDLQAVMDAIDLETGVADKLTVAQEIEQVCLLSEQAIWYTSKAELRTRFSWI